MMHRKNKIHAALALLVLSCAAQSAAAQVDWETETHDRGQIRFARGRNSAVVRGRIGHGDRDQYMIRARAGQLMSVRLDSADARMGFDVSVTTGFEALPVTKADALQREWSGKLPAGDEYYISVLTPGAGGEYSLDVKIENAAASASRGTATTGAGVAGGAMVAKELRAVLPKVKRGAGVPVLLPSELPASLDRPFYVVGGPSEAGYGVSLMLSPDCGGANACTLGSFTAERGGELVEEFERVGLANGVRGAYKPLTCGASCSAPMIGWLYEGVLYTVQLKLNAGGDAGDKAALIKIANSAISAGPR